jgi:glycosyltransferase involved in cell wall biosynthesis
MATSLPVIATNVGGNSDIVSDGITATIVPSDDVDSLAGAILTYWRDRDLAEQHGTAGRARIKTIFEANRMVTAYDKLFKLLLNRNNKRASPDVVQRCVE